MNVRVALVFALCLSGCEAILDIDRLEHGHGGDLAGADFAGADFAGDDLSGTVMEQDGSTMGDGGEGDGGVVPYACKNLPGGPYYDIENPVLMAETNAPTSIQLFDENGDGKLDIVFSDNNSMLHVLHQSTTVARQFAAATVVSNGCTSGYNDAMLVGDFDKDGINDLVIPCDDYQGGTEVKIVSFMKGNKGGGFVTPKTMMSPPDVGRAGVAVDADQDGTVDAVMLVNDPPGVVVYWGGTSFTSTAPYTLSTPAVPKGDMTGLATAPLGGDKVPDFVFTYADDNTGGGYQTVRNTRTGNKRTLVAATADLIKRASNEPLVVGLGNLDSTPGYDLVGGEVGTDLYGAFGVVGTKGATTFGTLKSIAQAFQSPNVLHIADLNCDGIDDVVLTHFQLIQDDFEYDHFEIWTSDSAGELTNVYTHANDTSDNAPESDSIASADIDGDGYIDLIITASSDTSYLRIYWGKASK